MNKKNIKITFTGDIFINNDLVRKYLDGKYSFDESFKNLNELFDSSDYVIGNLETPISENVCDYKNKPFTFCSPIDLVKNLKKSGIDCFTTANNHCLDNGVDGLLNTVKCLDKIGVDHTGVHSKYLIKEINGVKIGIYSCTYGTNAFNNNCYLKKFEKHFVNLTNNQELYNPVIRKIYKSKCLLFRCIRKLLKIMHLFQMDKMPFERIENSKKRKKIIREDIEQLKEKSDLIFVCLHDGLQNNKIPSKKLIKNVEFFSKLGVDMIICNHEHLIQKFEYVNNVPVFYCLGNFSAPTGNLEEPYDDNFNYSLLVNIYIDVQSKKISSKSFIITKQQLIKNNNIECNEVVIFRKMIEKNLDKISKKMQKEKYEDIINLVGVEINENNYECYF